MVSRTVCAAVLLAAPLVSAACYSWSQTELDADLRKRASFDLDCPGGNLRLVPLGEFKSGLTSSQGVKGCGKRATYVLSDSGVWIMNTDPDGNARQLGQESTGAEGRTD